MNHILSLTELSEFLRSSPSETPYRSLLFYSARHEASQGMVSILERVTTLFPANSEIKLLKLECFPSITKQLAGESLPSLWIARNGELVCRLQGSDSRKMAAVFKQISEGAELTVEKPDKDLASFLADVQKIVALRVAEIFKNEIVLAGSVPVITSFVEKDLKINGIDQYEAFDFDADFEIKEKVTESDGHTSGLYIRNVWKQELTAPLAEVAVAELKEANLRAKEDLHKYLKDLTTKSDVVLFMKGTKAQPFCKFSRAITDVLVSRNIDFDYVNIFEEPRVRSGMKDFSNWPTFPQLYVMGKFVGGNDIVQEINKMSEDQKSFKENIGLQV